jgi:dTDP-4-amino-4,6-dideoxy-D-galactose acyltransferase
MKVRPLEWDSHFFKKRVGEVLVSGGEEIVTGAEDYDLLYVKSNSKINLEIEGFTNSYGETRLIFSKRIIDPDLSIDDHIHSVFDVKIDKKDLYELAFESGRYSRFQRDKRFTDEVFKNLYKEWIDNSFKKDIADEVFIFLEEKKILGFVSFRKEGQAATIGLIAVNTKSRGKGVGSRLIQRVEKYLWNNQVLELRIPTQSTNSEAGEFYTKLGYKVIERTEINHYWKL